ncbi:MAG TPA: ATP-binding protein [Kofleriaceae bacterium]|nr:ATP-binding protein [Kofleriaceae bacterium]
MDVKSSWNEVIRVAAIQTIAAFANDFQGLNGGYVILGIEDRKGQPVLPPRGLDGLDLERVQNEIRGGCERIAPSYQPIILPEVFEGKQIIVIYAPMGDARPYQAPDAIAKGATLAYYVRIGAETHRDALVPRSDPATDHSRARVPLHLVRGDRPHRYRGCTRRTGRGLS